MTHYHHHQSVWPFLIGAEYLHQRNMQGQRQLYQQQQLQLQQQDQVLIDHIYRQASDIEQQVSIDAEEQEYIDARNYLYAQGTMPSWMLPRPGYAEDVWLAVFLTTFGLMVFCFIVGGLWWAPIGFIGMVLFFIMLGLAAWPFLH